MLVQDLMLMKVYSCRDTDSVIDCARMMREEKIGFVPIVDSQDKIVGVVTDRDIAVRLVAADLPFSTPVWRIMSSRQLLTVHPDDNLMLLEEKMARERKGRAIVVDKLGHLAGVVSLSDIAGAEPSAERTAHLVREVARRESVSIVKQ